jgi:hypothetical protein
MIQGIHVRGSVVCRNLMIPAYHLFIVREASRFEIGSDNPCSQHLFGSLGFRAANEESSLRQPNLLRLLARSARARLEEARHGP